VGSIHIKRFLRVVDGKRTIEPVKGSQTSAISGCEASWRHLSQFSAQRMGVGVRQMSRKSYCQNPRGFNPKVGENGGR
jgi:hypothetical protein